VIRRKTCFVAATAALIALFAGCGDNDNNPAGSGEQQPSGVLVVDSQGGQSFAEGNITTNTTWTSDNTYVLRGAVFVEEGATLTIQPGTVIQGESSSQPPGTMIVAQGARIIADGTAENPIVFTSDQPVGDRGRGQWGGLIINGRAPLNTGDTAEGEGDTGRYGGNIPGDDSGILRYVRVEYAGIEFSPDNELNGIAFQGVGSGTVVDYIQVHYNQDDGVEFFGGTVNAKHVLCTGIRDDSFDWTDGWTGKGQFWVAQQVGDDADQGFEADNNGDNNDLVPRSDPTIYNFTLIGDPNGPESDTGMLLREGTAGTIRNGIVMGFNLSGIDIDQSSTAAQISSGGLSVESCLFYGNTPANFHDDDEGEGLPAFDESTWAVAAGLNLVEADPILMAPYNTTVPDFRPGAGSPALDGTVPVAAPPADGFFEAVDYIGGVDPGDDWTQGWTNFSPN